MEVWMDGWKYGSMDGWRDRCVDCKHAWMDRRLVGWTVWMDGWMDEWKDEWHNKEMERRLWVYHANTIYDGDVTLIGQ